MGVEVNIWTGKGEERLAGWRRRNTTMPKVKLCPRSDVILTIATANEFSCFMSLSSSPGLFASASYESKSAEFYVVQCISFFTPATYLDSTDEKKGPMLGVVRDLTGIEFPKFSVQLVIKMGPWKRPGEIFNKKWCIVSCIDTVPNSRVTSDHPTSPHQKN